ncbi:Biogenesis of lysosome-related organelles complex 1 subunit 6 [Lucilia cuprina]|uniref:Biogenesis of lysosome-related organelles complex 1 subunit 6 n=1 Tax=Lucilia cuprina TaxID=7375 RepID=A0A0L0CGH5_LUCCU|nr:Biogenesis of lysosome-related organelles complex 1 subunit 6 [Lucilia cuprina]KNC30599.1 Biogenesis of lysosome-related organelles complex 1 subunit 6 [Lucilia cuprina]
MLKSNNFNSIVDDLTAFSTTENVEQLRPSSLEQITSIQEQNSLNNNNIKQQSNVNTANNDNSQTEANTSLAALQLTAGVLQSYAPPIAKARGQLKELIQKQNKIYIDLSAEKFKLDNAEVAKLQDMMINVKVCREKLLKIKKHMQNIYQRTKVLKKRAINIQTCKEKELQRKLQKQQQEESLIGKIN